MLQVRKDLCLGCGLCANSCPQQAISLFSGQVEIDRNRCNECGICLNVCPQGAIVELAPVSESELKATVTGLRSKTDSIIARIDKLKEKRSEVKKERY